MSESALALTVAVSIFSLIVSSLCIFLTVLFIKQYAKMRGGKSDSTYFRVTSQTALIGNTLCAISISIYCLWVTIDPPVDEGDNNNEWFIAVRATPTVFWWASKVSIVYLYNGRLYFTFLRSHFKSKRWIFIFVNVTITICAPLSLICGFIGVHLGNPIMITTSFQGFRTLYFLLTLILVFTYIINPKFVLYIYNEIVFQSEMRRLQNKRFYFRFCNNLITK